MKVFLCRSFLATALAACLSSPAYTQTLALQWAKALPGANKLAVDAQKNVYVTGGFSGTADFDPGPGVASLTSDTSFGLGAYFLAKYDAQGAFIFVKQMPAQPLITLDNSGNLWLAGSFSTTKDFDPGPGSAPLISAGSGDLFVAKYDATGAYLSAFRIGGSGFDGMESFTVDVAGNVYITGSFASTVDFDPGAGTQNLTAVGQSDIYLAKYSGTGTLGYAFRLSASSTSSSEEGSAVAVDAAGNVYLGGRYQGTIDLDPGTGTASFSAIAGLDGFIAKYDASGAYISGFNINGNVYDIELDATNNLWVTGTTADSSDMDPGPGVAAIFSVSFFDIYLAKYTSALSYIQARAFQSNATYVPEGLAVNYQNAAYIHGRFPDTVNLNPGGAGGTFISQGNLDGFVAKYDASNSYVLGASFGGTGVDQATGLALDNQGSVWMCGRFIGTVDFDPGAGTMALTSTAAAGFIARYTDPNAITGIRTMAIIQPAAKIFGAGRSVIVDFTALEGVDAQVRVTNLLGQPIVSAHHTRADMLRLPLPDAAAGLYVVMVSNGGARTTQKIWMR